MLAGLIWLLGCQLAGEVAVRVTGVPLPGPVVGMVLLLALLTFHAPSAVAGVFRVSDILLSHLQLFFVPAGVGVVVYLGVLRDQAWPVALGLVGSWLIGLVVVGGLVSVLVRRRA